MSTTHQTFEDDGQDDITTGNLYNGNGQRIRLTWNGSLYQKYYYMGSALFFTTDANNLRDSENILSPGGSIVASRRQDSSDANKYYFYHTDIRGSVTNIVGTKENAIYLAQGYNYDNFGKEEELKSESSFKNDVTFTGAVSDSMTGLYYMNARHYDPDTGRFLQQDTYKGSAAVPWTQHLYAYTGNNPVNMVDPTGHYTNTASDQYANYRYDFEKKTLVPYQDAQNQYNGYERTNMIPKRRTPQPSRSSSWQNDASNQYVEPGSGRIYSSGGYTYAPETGWIDQLLNANAANNGHSSGSSAMYMVAGGIAEADGSAPYGDAIGVILVGLAGLLRTMPANPARDWARDDAEPYAVPDTSTKPRRQMIFPENPYDFHPRGLVPTPYPTRKNGLIIKWEIPGTKVAIFEWDENILNLHGIKGAHYHLMTEEDNNHHNKDGWPANSLVPEPWNSIYF